MSDYAKSIRLHGKLWDLVRMLYRVRQPDTAQPAPAATYVTGDPYSDEPAQPDTAQSDFRAITPKERARLRKIYKEQYGPPLSGPDTAQLQNALERKAEEWSKWSVHDEEGNDGRYQELIGSYTHGTRLQCAKDIRELLAAQPAPARPVSDPLSVDAASGYRVNRPHAKRKIRVVD